jgi:hypothetical protein
MMTGILEERNEKVFSFVLLDKLISLATRQHSATFFSAQIFPQETFPPENNLFPYTVVVLVRGAFMRKLIQLASMFVSTLKAYEL